MLICTVKIQECIFFRITPCKIKIKYIPLLRFELESPESEKLTDSVSEKEEKEIDEVEAETKVCLIEIWEGERGGIVISTLQINIILFFWPFSSIQGQVCTTKLTVFEKKIYLRQCVEKMGQYST